ncbi:uncharacterized protein [Diadema antillarum]|uniref:uncharacterized protein n=1 Tax=Diadema antillarum TaxID=105358 RepID=UPI003A88FDBC
MPTIGVCTSAMQANIQAFLTRLRETSNANIKFVQLPYNAVGSYPLDSRTMDGIILCHSIHNRRFGITDVMDALYDEFLPNARRVFGRDNVAVIGHDFKWPFGDVQSGKGHARVKETHMASFRVKQPTTFQCSGLALICGRLDERVEMDEDDLQMLQEFVDSVKSVPLFSKERQPADRRAILFALVSPLILFALVLSLILFVLMIVLLATDWLDTAGKVLMTMLLVALLVPHVSWIIMHAVCTNGRRELGGSEFVDSVKPVPLFSNENQASHRRDIFFASASSFTLSILMIVLLATDWLDTAGKVTVTIVIEVVVVVPERSYLIMQVHFVVYTSSNRENHWYTCKWWLAPLRFWRHVSVSLFNFLRSLRSSSSTEYTSVPSMA